MKKLLIITLAFCAVIVAMACGSNDLDVDGVTGATEQNGESGEGTAKGKMLLVYFSRAGENWQAYPAAYNECISYVNDIEIPQNLRPAYKNDITNLADYETVFIGGPIWWARPPMIIRTFMEAHPELADKTIIPFGTHGGSGVGSYTTLIKEYFPNATVLESLGIAGVSIRDASSKQTVENWLKKLGVDKQSTAITNVRTRSVDNGVSYTLNGMPSNNQRGLYIKRSAEGRLQGKNGKKYVSK